jgi:predicted negative regulator of RcsB-dependent stress response
MPASRSLPPRFQTDSDRSERFYDWVALHQREASWAVLGVAVVLGGLWFYNRSRNLKEERAERAYFAAQPAAQSGNYQLAESDLRKMAQRYQGTRAGTQGRIRLAQVLFEQGKYQQGINELKADKAALESKDFAAPVHVVLAAGYEQLKQYKGAADEYGAAAKAARFDTDRQRYTLYSAHARLMSGDTAAAKRLYSELGADSKGVVAGEARVRLGELTPTAVPKS